ncbi:MAG: hypothetical protein E6R07_14070 [Nevskiaceae bacterium]|nr:MAG: hypothetical protein E6R07_14070 [Nevskiaceae bacterium]
MRETHPGAGEGFDPGRRSLLKLGLAGSLALGTVSLGAGLSGCGRREEAAAQGYRFLRDADLVLFRGLIPAVTASTLPTEAAAREARFAEILHRIDGSCLRLGAPAQKEVRKLFDLLNFGLTRRLAAGVSSPWSEVSEADALAFLDRWRSSSIGLFNAGYRVLTKLIAVANYGTPAVWASAGYPGPLDWMYKAVNS